MKYLKLIILGLALCPLAVISQKKLTLEDASGMNRAIFPAPVRNLQWIGSSDFFGYTESESFLKRKVTATDASTLLTLAALNQMLAASGLDSLTRLPSMKWQDDFSFTFTSKNTVLGVNLKSKTITTSNSPRWRIRRALARSSRTPIRGESSMNSGTLRNCSRAA